MVEEKVVRRGGVWWIDAGISVGDEEKMGRPGVVVSGDGSNEKCGTVVVAYCTTRLGPSSPLNCKVVVRGKTNKVLCNQLCTVDKSRLNERLCTLTEPEMVRVGGALAGAMCIPQ